MKERRGIRIILKVGRIGEGFNLYRHSPESSVF